MFIVTSKIQKRLPKVGLDLIVGQNGFAALTTEQHAALTKLGTDVSVVEVTEKNAQPSAPADKGIKS
jgi:hypothetical protein